MLMVESPKSHDHAVIEPGFTLDPSLNDTGSFKHTFCAAKLTTGKGWIVTVDVTEAEQPDGVVMVNWTG